MFLLLCGSELEKIGVILGLCFWGLDDGLILLLFFFFFFFFVDLA